LVLIAIFSTGVAGGWLAANHMARRRALRPPPPEIWVARQIERLAGEVQLTPEQRERIRPVVAAKMDELIKLRRQAIDILDQMGKQIAAELTPEQRTRYEKILQERREARRQAQEMRNARHRGDGAPGGREPPPDEGGEPPPPPPLKSSGT
jgi:Spy/CpxP family protein refolding chaperone